MQCKMKQQQEGISVLLSVKKQANIKKGNKEKEPTKIAFYAFIYFFIYKLNVCCI